MPPTGEPTAVLLIAHGSRHEPANDDLHALAARFAAAGRYPIVEACFLELAEPDIAAGGGRCVARGAARVLMIPYFLSAGVHLLRDLTAARDELGPATPRRRVPARPAPRPPPPAGRAGRRPDRRARARGSARIAVASDEINRRYVPMD